MSVSKLSQLNYMPWLLIIVIALTCISACGEAPETIDPPRQTVRQQPSAESDQQDEEFRNRRATMVEQQLVARDIVDKHVLEVMKRVPRHQFVPEQTQRLAYLDRPLPIGHRQTISQPYIVALMTQLTRPTPQAKALDIGTGSGYQAAVLAELVNEVYSIEILEPLASTAKKRLQQLGYQNVRVRHGDGYHGWPDQAPFDVIIVAAAPDHIPQALVEQLKPGGRLVIPVGGFYQKLLLIEKGPDGSVTQRSVTPVSFVPMTGEAELPLTEVPKSSER